MKKKELKLEEIQIELYRLNYGRVKEVVLDATNIFNKLLGMLEKSDDEITKVIVPFIQENIDELEKILFKVTNLNSDTIKEVYIEEFPEMFKELLEFNNIKAEQIMSFFQKALSKNLGNLGQSQEQ